MSYLQPVQQTGTRTKLSADDGKFLYLKSYLLMRAVIGFIGIFLPIALLVGDWLVLQDTGYPRGSLSAYYHSGMRDLFVGCLCVTALFLITYKVFESNLDNALSLLAGIAALGVAWLPTGRPKGSTSAATPLQERLGESGVTVAHFICAGIFICSLGILSYFFGRREGTRPDRDEKERSNTFWRRFHWWCAGAIFVAVAFMLITEIFDWFESWAILAGEIVAGLAFGLSWLMKGLELKILRKPVHTSEAAVTTP